MVHFHLLGRKVYIFENRGEGYVVKAFLIGEIVEY